MLFGATNNPLRPLADEIKTLAILGFDYLELCLDPPEGLPETIRARELMAILDGVGLNVAVAHLPASVWLADIYESIRQASVMEVIKSLDLCARLPVHKAVLHPGYFTGLIRSVPDLGRKHAVASLESILSAARERQVMICLENMFPRTGYLFRPNEMGDILEHYPELMMTLDISHAAISAPAGQTAALIETGGDRIAHVHVSDNRGTDDDHLPVGAGRVDVSGAFRLLKKIGYDDTMTLEVFSADRDYLKQSLDKVKIMWAEA
jgi:sugar phosphate isomerase/epimerase